MCASLSIGVPPKHITSNLQEGCTDGRGSILQMLGQHRNQDLYMEGSSQRVKTSTGCPLGCDVRFDCGTYWPGEK